MSHKDSGRSSTVARLDTDGTIKPSCFECAKCGEFIKPENRGEPCPADSDIDKQTPPPGSEEAIQEGCKCPVIDNNHGDGITIMPYFTEEQETYYIQSADCPLHGTEVNYDG